MHARATRSLFGLGLLGFSALLGCGPQEINLPAPRPLITSAGERLRAEPEKLAEIDAWVRAELDSISQDPSFWIITQFQTETFLPWEGLEISNDTATIKIEAAPPEVQSTYQIYAHLHLMAAMNRLDVWLPEAPGATGFALEKAILTRTSDAWLYARSIFDAIPYPALDELMYANQQGYLDAYILTARPDEYADERVAWLAASPGQQTEYAAWFEKAFERPPPGRRENVEGS